MIIDIGKINRFAQEYLIFFENLNYLYTHIYKRMDIKKIDELKDFVSKYSLIKMENRNNNSYYRYVNLPVRSHLKGSNRIYNLIVTSGLEDKLKMSDITDLETRKLVQQQFRTDLEFKNWIKNVVLKENPKIDNVSDLLDEIDIKAIAGKLSLHKDIPGFYKLKDPDSYFFSFNEAYDKLFGRGDGKGYFHGNERFGERGDQSDPHYKFNNRIAFLRRGRIAVDLKDPYLDWYNSYESAMFIALNVYKDVFTEESFKQKPRIPVVVEFKPSALNPIVMSNDILFHILNNYNRELLKSVKDEGLVNRIIIEARKTLLVYQKRGQFINIINHNRPHKKLIPFDGIRPVPNKARLNFDRKGQSAIQLFKTFVE